MRILYKIAILSILMFWQLMASGQTNAVARLDTNSILIGDQVELELSFVCPIDYKVSFPLFTDTITGNIEILEQSEIDSSYNSSKTEKYFTQTLTITSFDSGYFAIPPVRYNFKNPQDKLSQFAETEALLLEVNTVPVDMSKDMKDIKGPIEAPFTFREALPYILIFLGVAVAAFLLYYFIRKRKTSEPIFKLVSKPKVPAHQIALDELETLRFKKLWQSGRIKEYHTELVDIVREYLEGKFQIHALEYTSDEIIDAVNGTSSNEEAKQKLRNSLMMADMVKFAKYEPMPLEHDNCLNNAVDFVKETIHLGIVIQEEPQNTEAIIDVEDKKPELIETTNDLSQNDEKEVKDVQ